MEAVNRAEVVDALLSGRVDPHVTLTGEEVSRVYAVARRAAEDAVKGVLRDREVDVLAARITPEVVADAERGVYGNKLWLTRSGGGWLADMGDAHPHPLSEHGPAREWLTRYFKDHEA